MSRTKLYRLRESEGEKFTQCFVRVFVICPLVWHWFLLLQFFLSFFCVYSIVTKRSDRMPALQWLCRKWRTGSDDFTWSGIGLALLSATAGIMALSKVDGSNSEIADCPLASDVFRSSFHGIGITSVVVACMLGILAFFSARGKIFEVKKRAAVPYLLYVVVCGLLIQFVISCIVAHRALYYDEVHVCTTLSTRNVVRAVIALSLTAPCIFVVLMLISFDPSGRRTFETEEDYHRLWMERCHIVCCCYSSNSRQEAFSEAAKTLAILFRGYDLVPSDIAAGMLLLQGYQTYQRYQRVKKTVQFAPDPLGRREVLSSQARPIPHISPDQRLVLDRIHYFAKYFLGAYGWMLYTYAHVFTGLPRLWAADCCMCCKSKRHDGVAYGETCGCDTTALKQVTGLPQSDIIMTSFENTIYRPCFYVAIDRPTNTIVIAVRGTMSLEDCITDMVASPAEMVLDTMTGEKGHVHSGMLQSATNLLQILIKDGVVQGLLTGAWKETNVTVLGHSLGAGTATILALLLHSRFPELRSRLRCIAYSPPGGLMSTNARTFAASFVEGAFVGFDVIPRMSAHNFDHLRDSLVAVLTHTSARKAAVFCLCCCPSVLGERLPEFRPQDTNSEHMRTLRRFVSGGVAGSPVVSSSPAGPGSPDSGSSPSAIALYPPLNMVHYVKLVRQASCGCVEPCVSTKGGLLTRIVTDEIWAPVFVAPEELSYVLCHPMMTLDHFPDRVFDVISATHQRLSNNELTRFMTSATPEAVSFHGANFDDEMSLVYAPTGFTPLGPSGSYQ